MKHAKSNCKVCLGERVITHEAGKNEYYTPCPRCNQPSEEDPDWAYENERDNNL